MFLLDRVIIVLVCFLWLINSVYFGVCSYNINSNLLIYTAKIVVKSGLCVFCDTISNKTVAGNTVPVYNQINS